MPKGKIYGKCPYCGKTVTNFNKGGHCYNCGTEFCKDCSEYVEYMCPNCEDSEKLDE